MNPIFIKVEKTDSGKFGIQVTHPPSHYMDGDERVEIPSRYTWLGHDGQDMMYGTGIEFATENEAKQFIGEKKAELTERAKTSKIDINCYLLIHHDAVIKWDGFNYVPKPIEATPVADVVREVKPEPDIKKDLEEHFSMGDPVVVREVKSKEIKEKLKSPTGQPRTALFIKSYKPDFVWLKYALKSIKKFCTGYHEVVIVVPNSDVEEAKTFVTDEKLIGIDEPPNGYLYQQVVKLNAHKYTECELIQYHDSDCIFITPTSPTDYMENGKPWQYCTPYEKVGDAIMWQGCVEKILGFKDQFERMRRHNIIYRRDSLEAIQKMFPDINSIIISQPGRHFSEFNLMGSFVAKYEPDNYIWKNTDEHPIIPERLKQFHSYSEYTAKTIEWLNEIIA